MLDDVKPMCLHKVFDILFLSIACIMTEVYFNIPSERGNLAIMP